jgi:hypothetical protein
METLHLITAVRADLAEHLGTTALSVAALRAQLADHGWDVRWHVAVDGDRALTSEPAQADMVMRIGRQVGVSCARNLALSATGGQGWVFRLDGDDELDVAGWTNLVADPAFGSEAWHPTNLLTGEGGRTAHYFDQPRRWERSAVEEHWTSPLAFHPGNVVVRAELALAVGGWPALRLNEDLAWCFALNALEPGLGLPHVTLRYRRWAKQTVADVSYVQDKAQAYAFITATVNARRSRAGLAPITAPPATAGALYLAS